MDERKSAESFVISNLLLIFTLQKQITMMKTTLPSRITTVEEAKAFLTELFDNHESYNPIDDAHDIDWTTCEPTEKEKDRLNDLMHDIYELPLQAGGIFFDAAEYLWDKIVAANAFFQSDEED